MNGLKWPTGEMMKLRLYSHAANVIIPTAGLSMAVVYADRAKEKGESRAAALSAVILSIVSDYTAISGLLIFALIYLFAINSLSLHVLIPAIIFLTLTGLLYVLIYTSGKGHKWPKKLIYAVVAPVSKMVGIFAKKKINPHLLLEKFFKEFGDVNSSIIKNPLKWVDSIWLSLTAHIFRIGALFVIFASLGYDPQIKVVLSGYALGVLFLVVSPTPEGVGFVEGAMTLAFTSFGIPASTASTATLLYRTLTFWFPFFIGFIMLQRSRLKRIFKESLEIES